MDVLKWIVDAYSVLVLARVVLGFVALPAAAPWRQSLAPITDQYLWFFRQRMPPVGRSQLDLSPVAALLVLRIVSEALTLAARPGWTEGMYR